MRGKTIYRNFEISYDPPPGHAPKLSYQYCHVDYDGPEDKRIGRDESIEACLERIDEWHDCHPVEEDSVSRMISLVRAGIERLVIYKSDRELRSVSIQRLKDLSCDLLAQVSDNESTECMMVLSWMQAVMTGSLKVLRDDD